MRVESSVELSVVIPCFNEATTLPAQLDALSAERWDGTWEVIVVDNGSTDETAAVARTYGARDPRFRVISATRGQSISYARNAGIRAARGELIAICDGDDIVQPGWVGAMGDALRTHPYVSGAVDPSLLNPSWLAASRPMGTTGGLPTYAGHVFASGASLGVRKSLWRELGGFDEQLRGLEDIEFGIRARAIGVIPEPASGAVVNYRFRPHLRATWRQGFNYGRGRREQNRRARAFGLEPAPLRGAIKSWLWLLTHLPQVRNMQGRFSITWVLANRVGAIRGGFDRYPAPQINIGHRGVHDDVEVHPPTTSSRFHGVLVTFRRPTELETTLEHLARQTRSLDTLVVVDNDADPEVELIVRSAAGTAEISYLANPGNPGPAGGIHAGASRVLASASDDDWLVILDDDDPPREDDCLASLREILSDVGGNDPRCGGVGLWGARLDRRTGRVRAAEGRTPERVSYLPGGSCPHYSVAALRRVGLPTPDLFFGFDDLELGMRFGDAGFSLYSSGIAREQGWTHMVEGRRVSLRSSPTTWRRYYSLRNLVVVLRTHGVMRGAITMSLLAGIAKPLVNIALHPRTGVQNLRVNGRALRDGWRNRLGKTIDPAGDASG